MIEQHPDGMIRFTVTKAASAQFTKDDPIDLEIEGQRVAGTVHDVKLGNEAAVVIVKSPGQPSV